MMRRDRRVMRLEPLPSFPRAGARSRGNGASSRLGCRPRTRSRRACAAAAARYRAIRDGAPTVLTREGRSARHREWLDTVLLPPRTRAEIAFVADNPGNWMLHCHVLEHQHAGMMAVVRVA